MPKAPPSDSTPSSGSLLPEADALPSQAPIKPAATRQPREPAGRPAEPLAPAATAAPAAPAQPMPATYELAMEELERIVSRIDAGKIPLEELLIGYRRGADLLAFCRERLQAVEEQIKVLDNGVLTPWSPT